MREAMYESYNDTDKDFTALINKMKQAKIDIIVLGGYHTAGALLIKQSREQGFGAQMVGFDALEECEQGEATHSSTSAQRPARSGGGVHHPSLPPGLGLPPLHEQTGRFTPRSSAPSATQQWRAGHSSYAARPCWTRRDIGMPPRPPMPPATTSASHIFVHVFEPSGDASPVRRGPVGSASARLRPRAPGSNSRFGCENCLVRTGRRPKEPRHAVAR